MISVKPYNGLYRLPFPLNPSNLQRDRTKETSRKLGYFCKRKLVVARSSGGSDSDKKAEKRSFLSLEEAGLVEMSGLSTHERFLCRLTISSLNLLRVVSEQEGCTIEELNAGRVCDWFIKDKAKRDQNLDSAVLQWDDSNFIM